MLFKEPLCLARGGEGKWEEDLSSYMLSICTPFLETVLGFSFEKFPTRPGQSDFSLLELNLELNDTGAENGCSWVILVSALWRDGPLAHIYHCRFWGCLAIRLPRPGYSSVHLILCVNFSDFWQTPWYDSTGQSWPLLLTTREAYQAQNSFLVHCGTLLHTLM